MADGRQNNGAKKGEHRGQGRKPKADEEKVRFLATAAITKKYGSEEQGFQALLDSQEPTLIKFVYEHAYGKPKERLEHYTPEGINIVFKRGKSQND
jgi:hypothetical protein